MKARIVIAFVRLACMVLLVGLILSPLGPPRPVAAPLHLSPFVGEAAPQAAMLASQLSNAQAAPLAQAGIAAATVSLAADQMLFDKGDGSTPTPATSVSLTGVETNATFLTPPTKAPLAFSDLASHFSGSVPPGAKVDIQVRFSSDGQTFGDWQPASFEIVADPERDKAGEFYASLVSVPHTTNADGSTSPATAQYAQAQLHLSVGTGGKGPNVTQFSFAFIDVPPSGAQPNVSAAASVPGRPALVQRSDWGAPSSATN